MTDRNKLLAMQLALVLACATSFLLRIGRIRPDRRGRAALRADCPRVLGRHDWIVPTLNGSPWLEKPALLFWKMMNSYSIFGVSDWAARIPAAVHATAVVVGIFFFMRVSVLPANWTRR